MYDQYLLYKITRINPLETHKSLTAISRQQQRIKNIENPGWHAKQNSRGWMVPVLTPKRLRTHPLEMARSRTWLLPPVRPIRLPSARRTDPLDRILEEVLPNNRLQLLKISTISHLLLLTLLSLHFTTLQEDLGLHLGPPTLKWRWLQGHPQQI